MTQLRLGCSRLQADQHYRRLADAPTCPLCDTGEDECRDHYLLRCPRWATERQQLWDDLAALNVTGLQLPCACPTLLGGQEEKAANKSQRRGILAATMSFVRKTGRLRTKK